MSNRHSSTTVMCSALKSDGCIQGRRSARSHGAMWPSSSEDDKHLLNLRFIGYSLKTSTPRTRSCESSGSKIVEPLEKKPWGLRQFTVEDLDGNRFYFHCD